MTSHSFMKVLGKHFAWRRVSHLLKFIVSASELLPCVYHENDSSSSHMMMMYHDNESGGDWKPVGDGTWTLQIIVTDPAELSKACQLRVRSDMHVGGVMLRLVEEIGVSNDWSDHALWDPKEERWLKRTKSTLDQYGVTAESELFFTTMHKFVKVQLPDLRVLDVMVDFSVKTFGAVANLCKRMGIRHSEELSFQKPISSDDLAYNYREDPRRRLVKPKRLDTNKFITNQSNGAPQTRRPVGTTSPNQSVGYSPYNTLNGTLHNSSFDAADSFNQDSFAHSDGTIKDVRNSLIHPRSMLEKARMNAAWLDSSLSLMEQRFSEFDTLSLKFKFYSFYDLNPKTDAIRINQIYEQAKWQILNEEIDCSEDEALMFAALQFQVRESRYWADPNDTVDFGGEDEIDAALTELQTTLEGSGVNGGVRGITKVPILEEQLRFMKHKKFSLKGFRPMYFVCRDTTLYLCKGSGGSGEPEYSVQLKGCEVTPHVSVSQRKYCIKLEVPASDGMTEMWIRCDNEDQYARWMAACRLGSKGKTLADPTYEPEVKSISSFLSMQKPSPAPAISSNELELDPEEYLPVRFLRRGKNRMTQRILEAHANVKDMRNVQAKMNYIQAWQRLPLYGISLFVVRFDDAKKEEVMGVGSNKLVKLDPQTGQHLKTWRLSSMKSWDINWEVEKMRIHFEGKEQLIFSIASADCKVFHEFLGGYIFLSMRSKEASQTLNEELFHKLTGGWV